MSDSYLLLIDKSLLKELQKFPAKQYKQVVTKLLSLAVEPKLQDCKALKGVNGGYRVDQGEYRILYYLLEPEDGQPRQVQIFRVGKRNDNEVYRNL
ncbi:MAG: type II toxin-antitoxin system RelE/ParE family toxin [Phormidesmis sp. CAN_BIN36]|nr:type II toxin-antitoxin system RelE/ParE family toxin [Phormidesmis sp. CAN_BIN36]